MIFLIAVSLLRMRLVSLFMTVRLVLVMRVRMVCAPVISFTMIAMAEKHLGLIP